MFSKEEIVPVYTPIKQFSHAHSQGRTCGALLLLRNSLLINGAFPQTE